ncbi:T-complex protein 1 subunit gamma-like [Rhopalosiphum maidis]|uniref:T-complex protein 1 subunit gamma-like n=1 Tax=Rhopalosiphum maidis TaxID=43146 RepID=UPI000EFF32BD|nr:T-complex protein 1 subunit gamma-like [Rhopalosiphum maidis]
MMSQNGAPVLVLNTNTKRKFGHKVQKENIAAGKAIADVVRTCIGPRAMLKMLMDPMGGIVMTNDGNAILREITVQHPAAKSFIEIARTQDEEVGDGTTSVVVLAGEILGVAEQFLEQKIHPTVIIRAYRQALEDMLNILDKEFSIPLPMDDENKLIEVIQSCIGTKFIGTWSDLACSIALNAVKTVRIKEDGRTEIDIKRYAKVEKVPGGAIEDSELLNGIMLNKDITHPKMRRLIKNPRIILLDCSLEFKKGESQTEVEIVKETDFTRLLQIEEEFIEQICNDIIALKPDLVCTEKGVSDLAQHYLMKANISVIRRLRKSDNNRIARACNATIVTRTDELREIHVGTGAGRFEVKKIGDEYFTFITECINPKACTILLRGPSKDILNEVERNLQDALHVAKNIMLNPRLVTGGGSIEMAISQALVKKSSNIAGVVQWPYKAVVQALEVIPRTLLQNCGVSTIRTMTSLRAKHSVKGNEYWGINGETGEMCNMKELKVWEPIVVKSQVYKTAIETAILLVRIDDIVSGTKKIGDDGQPKPSAQPTEESMKE